MKLLKAIFIIGCIILSASAFAQEKPNKNQESSFSVEGVCNMCKKRIEKAALIPGVKMATWDKEESLLKVIYDDRKIDLVDIQKAVAAAGHDTKDIVASDSSYSALPGCCAYRGGKVKKH